MAKLLQYFNTTMVDKGSKSFDTWSGDEGTLIFCKLLTAYQQGHTVVKIGGQDYILSFRSGGGVGMGEYPSSMTVTKVTECVEITLDF